MTAHPPQLSPERVDQMIAYATSYAQEKRKPTFLQILSTYRSRFAFSAGSALVAASIVFFVSSEAPNVKKVPRAMPSEVSDIMLYDLLEDLS